MPEDSRRRHKRRRRHKNFALGAALLVLAALLYGITLLKFGNGTIPK